MSHVVFIDCHGFNFGIMQRAAQLGHRVTLIRPTSFQWYSDSEYIRSVIKLIDRVVDIKVLTDTSMLLEAIRQVLKQEPIDAVINLLDPTIETTAHACSALEIPFTSLEGVLNSRDKARARELIATAGLSSLRYSKARDIKGVIAAVKQFDYPLIMKPVSGFGSVLCSRVNNAREAFLAAQEILSAAEMVPEMIREQFDRGVLIEECVKGELVSAEVGMLNNQMYRFAVTGRSLPEVNECVEMGGIIPADISESQANGCFDYAERICEVLGLDFGVFHIEMMITDNGPVLIEANPRLMGGVMTSAYQFATGCNINDLVIEIYLGRPIQVALPRTQGFVTIRKMIPLRNGRLNHSLDLSWFDNLKDCVAHLVNHRIEPGLEVERFEVLGRFLVWSESLKEATEKADWLLDQFEKSLGVKLIKPK